MREIYLDNAATTRVSKKAADIAYQTMISCYGNPSSLHKKGLEAELIMTTARNQIAYALGCKPSEIIFTSGGTEANNLAILGATSAKARAGKTIITTAVEHSSVAEPFEYLKKNGYNVVVIPPNLEGSLDIEAVVDAVTDDTVLISCMFVNSELGSISDIANAVKLTKRKNKNLLFHTDAVQAFGKIPFTAKSLGVDLLTISGHKIHGPKGVGALYVKAGARILPTVFGGNQEQGLRSGTEAVPLAAAFGCAAEEIMGLLKNNQEKMRTINEQIDNKLQSTDYLCSNSPPNGTLYIRNLSMPQYRSEIILHYLAEKGIYISSGSACSKGVKSPVLKAMNLSNDKIDSALRISFSAETTTEDIDCLFDELEQASKDILRS